MVGRERAVPQAVAAGAAGTETLGMDPRTLGRGCTLTSSRNNSPACTYLSE
jgi:hypothetical protein